LKLLFSLYIIQSPGGQKTQGGGSVHFLRPPYVRKLKGLWMKVIVDTNGKRSRIYLRKQHRRVGVKQSTDIDPCYDGTSPQCASEWKQHEEITSLNTSTLATRDNQRAILLALANGEMQKTSVRVEERTSLLTKCDCQSRLAMQQSHAIQAPRTRFVSITPPPNHANNVILGAPFTLGVQ